MSWEKAECIPGSHDSSWGQNPLTAPEAVRDTPPHDKLRAHLASGRRDLMTKLLSSPLYTFGSGERLATHAVSPSAIYHIRAGWACRFHDLPEAPRAIIYIFLPGDVIGVDVALRRRTSGGVLSLTSVTAGVIEGQDTLVDLMVCRHTALYITWLLTQRQQRTDRQLISVLSLDARGRVATILLDVYTRLRRRRLITGLTYSLPLTQMQFASYLGITVVHVNRVLRYLREERIVQLEKHCVTILDLDRLRKLAQQEVMENTQFPIIAPPLSGTGLSRSEAADLACGAVKRDSAYIHISPATTTTTECEAP